MGIAKHKPDAASPVKINLPKVEPEAYKSIVVDDAYTPLNSLIAYVDGAPWACNYYSQVISEHTDLREHDPGQVGAYQQYSKIIGLELRVSTALQPAQDTDNATMTVTGTALVYPFLTPNVGDLFVAAVTGGHDGLFRISNVERKTFNRDSIFSVDYDLVAYIDVAKERFADLESKVNKTVYFNKDRLIEGQQPTLVAEDHQNYSDLAQLYRTLCEFYFKTFFNKEYSTLVLPGQLVSIYDSFLVNYILKIVDTFDALEIRSVNQLPTEKEPYLSQTQFWTVLFERDETLLGYCNREMGLVPTKTFGFDPMLEGLRYTKLQYIIYPKMGDGSVFSERTPAMQTIAITDLVEAESQASSLSSLIHDQFIEQNQTIPYTKAVLSDKNYVFSQSFYEMTAGQSLIESLTLDYIKGNPINVANLSKLAQRFKQWGRLEQFYYIPIILTLIKAVRGG